MTAGRWRPHRGEGGSSLVLALVVVTLLGVYGTLLLGYGWTGLRETSEVRRQRAASYAADSGLTAGIGVVRRDPARGGDPGQGGTCETVTLPDAAGGPVDVACVGQSGSGAVSPGVDAPRHAVLTLGGGSETGIDVSGSGTLAVDGAVFAHSSVRTGTGALDAGSSPVTARGACRGAVTGNPVACDVGDEAHPEAADPAYPSPLSVLPTYQTVPACPGPNRVVALTPGFYDDAAGLTALTGGLCRGTLLWLQPGAYYFDFTLDPLKPTTWTVADAGVNVVGGTPQGWAPPVRRRIDVPGGCKTYGDSAPNAGVQLVFGADSRLAVTGGSMEICATPSETALPLALYGQTTSVPSPPGSATLRATSVANSGTAPFANPANARAIGENGGPLTSDAALASATPPPLDLIGQAPVGAYGLRRLRSAYAGPAIRVRRSSNNQETDVGFDANGNLDLVTLGAWVGRSHGYVTTWYDQSGGNRHLGQTVSGQQGRIVIGGVIQSGIRFTGASNSNLSATTGYPIASNSSWDYATVLTARANPTAGTATDQSGWYFVDRTVDSAPIAGLKVVQVGRSSLFCLQKRSDANQNIGCATSTTAVTVNARQMVMLEREFGTAFRIYVNGTAEGTNTVGPSDPLTPPILELNAARGGTAANAEYHELVVFPAMLTAADRQRLEGSQAWYWGLTNWLPAGHPYRSLPPATTRDAALTWSALDPLMPPPGSADFRATLRLAHGEQVPPGAGISPDANGGAIVPAGNGTLPPGQTATGRVDLRVTVTPGDGSPACVVSVPATARPGGGALTTAAFDVTSCTDTAAKRSGLTIRYRVNSTAGVPVAAAVDGAELDITYTPPSLRAQSGCVAQAGGCAWVDTGPAGRLLVQGTVYAPAALLDLDLGGSAGRSSVSRGVILRALAVRDPGSGPTVGLGARREVELVASIDGRRRARALVVFHDSPMPGQSTEVREWSVTRG